MNKNTHVDYGMIGSRIKAKRKEMQLTQEKLAEGLNVTVGYVSQLERGITKISLDKLAEISDILDCDIAYFIMGASVGSSSYLQNELLDGFAALTNEQRKYILGFMDVMRNFGTDNAKNL